MKQNGISTYLTKETSVLFVFMDTRNGIELTRSSVFELIVVFHLDRKIKARETELEKLDQRNKYEKFRILKMRGAFKLKVSGNESKTSSPWLH